MYNLPHYNLQNHHTQQYAIFIRDMTKPHNQPDIGLLTHEPVVGTARRVSSPSYSIVDNPPFQRISEETHRVMTGILQDTGRWITDSLLVTGLCKIIIY